MDIVCIEVIFVGQLCSIQLADHEIFKVSEITRFPKLPAFTLLGKGHTYTTPLPYKVKEWAGNNHKNSMQYNQQWSIHRIAETFKWLPIPLGIARRIWWCVSGHRIGRWWDGVIQHQDIISWIRWQICCHFGGAQLIMMTLSRLWLVGLNQHSTRTKTWLDYSRTPPLSWSTIAGHHMLSNLKLLEFSMLIMMMYLVGLLSDNMIIAIGLQ